MYTIDQLRLAWIRTKLDRPSRCFVIHPYLIGWIDAHLDEWLSALLKAIDGGYQPQGSQVCYAPKAGWTVRPGSALEIQDEVVVNALLGNHHEKLFRTLTLPQTMTDIAYQLKSPGNPEWIMHWSVCNKEWQKKSLAILEQGAQYVLFTDIAAFYENIDFNRLHSDLISVGFAKPDLDLLMSMLHKWAQPRGKGVPQGLSASDILVKLYMQSIDQALSNEGITHLRYVDDIRIFCHSEMEARYALLKLNKLLRNRGLNLQTAKTKILNVKDARTKINGISPIIDSIQEQLRADLIEFNINVGEYPLLSDIEKFTLQNPHATPLKVIVKAFNEYFLDPAKDSFDKTLFHYLLTRLGKAKSPVAIDYCAETLSTRPEETEYVLRYFECFSSDQRIIGSMIEYLQSNIAIYDYQNYLLVKWFYEQKVYPNPLLAKCREWAFDKNIGQWLRTYCVATLGIAGDNSDLENVEGNYNTASSEIEKAEYIMALQRLEKGRRNSFYGRVRNDGFLVRCAVNCAKKMDNRQ